MFFNNQNHKGKKKSRLFYALLSTLILMGCVKDMANLSINVSSNFSSFRAKEICEKNIQISKTKQHVAKLRSDINYSAGAIKQHYYILERCESRGSSRYQNCVDIRESIEGEEFRLFHLRLEEAAENENYSAFSIQCNNYVSNIPAGTSKNSYQISNMRWIKPLATGRVQIRHAAIKQIAQEHNIRLTAWETRDEKTNSYILRDIIKLEYKFFDAKGDLTSIAKDILPAILGKYATVIHTPSPPTLTVIIPFPFKSDADKFIAKGEAEKHLNNLKQYIQEMLSISRPINYSIQGVKEGTVGAGIDTVIIQEAASE